MHLINIIIMKLPLSRYRFMLRAFKLKRSYTDPSSSNERKQEDISDC